METEKWKEIEEIDERKGEITKKENHERSNEMSKSRKMWGQREGKREMKMKWKGRQKKGKERNKKKMKNKKKKSE